MNYKKLFFILLIVIGSIFSIYGCMTYFLLQKKHDYILPNMNLRVYNYFVARDQEFDTVILGSSMSENFKASDVDSALKASSLNFSMSGSTYYERRCASDYFFYRKPNIHHIISDLHVTTFNYPADHSKTFPKDLYKNKNISFKNLFQVSSLRMFGMSMKTFFSDKNITDTQAMRNSLCAGFSFKSNNRKQLARDVQKPRKVIFDINLERTNENLNANVIPWIKSAPNTTFHLFFPPYFILFYQKDKMDEFLEYKRLIVNTLSQFNNVKIYDFQIETDIITNLDIYKDITHYNANISSWMTSNLENEDYIITPKNLEERLTLLKETVKSYPNEETQKELLDLLK